MNKVPFSYRAKRFGKAVVNLGKSVRDLWQPQSIADLEAEMDRQSGGAPSASGSNVSEQTAMTVAAWFDGVRQISQDVASEPKALYRKLDDKNREKYLDHPLYDVFHCTANPEMTSFNFVEALQNHALNHGNGYAEQVRNRRGQVVELWPLTPLRTKPARDENGVLYYQHLDIGGKIYKIPANRMFHLPGFGFDGRIGYSPITLARESLGLTLSQERFASNFFGQGTNLGGVFTMQDTMKQDAFKAFKEDFYKKFSGVGNTHKALILEKGMTWEPLEIHLADQEFLNTRIFSIDEIARWLNIPAHKIKEHSHSTFSNVEELERTYATSTIFPWNVRWEQNILKQLLDASHELFIEFSMDGLLRGDIVKRYTAYNTGRNCGFLSANDIRRKENMNTIDEEWADQYYWPLNMYPSSTVMDKSSQETTTNTLLDDKIDGKNTGAEDKTSINTEKKCIHDHKIEERSSKTVTNRRRIAQSYKPVFERILKKRLEKDSKNIKMMAEQAFSSRSYDSFKDQLYIYFKKNRKEIKSSFDAVFNSLGNELLKVAAEEVNVVPEEFLVDFNKYVDEFSKNETSSYIINLRSRLLHSLKVAIEENKDPLVAVNNKMDDLEITQPQVISDRSIIDSENGFSQFVFFAAGYKTVWRNSGNESCPYCRSLEGKVVGSSNYFMKAGDLLNPTGADHPLLISSNTKHPSLHAGCDCYIEAVR